jgi:hypothetical protein
MMMMMPGMKGMIAAAGSCYDSVVHDVVGEDNDDDNNDDTCHGSQY